MAECMADFFDDFIDGLGQKYQPYIRQHLSNVYMILGVTTVATAVGAVAQVSETLDLGIYALVASIGLLIGLHFYRYNGKNYYPRFRMLKLFGFCTGQTLGPVLQLVIDIDPAIIWSALVSTAIIFASLSLSALYARRGKYLFLGGLLASVLNTMAVMSLLNLFLQSYFVQRMQIYIGVVVVAGYILVDTQNIIEKRRAGDRDAVQHALDLFFDAFNLFWRFLFILAHKKNRRNVLRRKKRSE